MTKYKEHFLLSIPYTEKQTILNWSGATPIPNFSDQPNQPHKPHQPHQPHPNQLTENRIRTQNRWFRDSANILLYQCKQQNSVYLYIFNWNL